MGPRPRDEGDPVTTATRPVQPGSSVDPDPDPDPDPSRPR